MEEVGYHLGVLDRRAGSDRLVTGTWLGNAFQPKACIDQQIQPLAERPCEPRDLELGQPLLHVQRCGFEEPLVNHPVEIAKVVADLYRIGQAVGVAQVPAVWSIEARMADGELKETARLQDAIGFRENPIRFRN